MVIHGQQLLVSFEEGAIHLTSNAALWTLLSQDVKGNVRELSTAIFNEYQIIFGKNLGIGLDSLSFEILGHVYAEHLLFIVRGYVERMNMRIDLSKIIRNCSVIDCGESDKDGNRWFWNMLTSFYDPITDMLPEKMKYRQSGNSAMEP